MMGILGNLGTYVASLLPSFKKNDIKNDIDHSLEELESTILPMYSDSTLAGSLMGTTCNALSYALKKNVAGYKSNPYAYIGKAANAIMQNSAAIQKSVIDEFNETNTTNISDYYKLNLLKYYEALHFFNEFSLKFISISAKETLGNSNAAVKVTVKQLANNDYQLFCNNQDNIKMFIIVNKMLNQPFEDFLKSIKNLKGHIYNEAEWSKTNASTGYKLDPYNANFIPVPLNPIYHVGMAINGWRVARYERNKATLTELQLMVLGLRKQKEGTLSKDEANDLQQRIDYHSNRIVVLEASIKQMEEGA